MKFLREFNFADFRFLSFTGTNFCQLFGFQTSLLGIIFHGFHVWYLKVTKTEAMWSPSWHCLQPLPLKFSNVNKRSKFLLNFCSPEFVFRGFNLRNLQKLDPTKISSHTVCLCMLVISKDVLFTKLPMYQHAFLQEAIWEKYTEIEFRWYQIECSPLQYPKEFQKVTPFLVTVLLSYCGFILTSVKHFNRHLCFKRICHVLWFGQLF